MQEKLFCYY